MPTPYVDLVASVIAETIGYSALNASAQFTKLWPSLLVIVGLGGSFYFHTLAPKQMPMGIIHAAASGLGTIFVAIFRVVACGQKPDLAPIVGLALIIAGIVITNAMSDFAVH